MSTTTTEQHPEGYATLHPHDWQRGGKSPTSGAVSWAQCGTCHRWWDDAFITSRTPAPSGRCPFEYEHADDPDA